MELALPLLMFIRILPQRRASFAILLLVVLRGKGGVLTESPYKEGTSLRPLGSFPHCLTIYDPNTRDPDNHDPATYDTEHLRPEGGKSP